MFQQCHNVAEQRRIKKIINKYKGYSILHFPLIK